MLHVVLPALNEAGNIERVLADLKALGRTVELRALLVDDGSTDGTSDAARAAAAGVDLEIIRHDRPRGPGRAFGSAFRHLEAELEPDDLVLTLEADNTSRLELVDVMLRRIGEGHDVVLASPYMYGGAIVQTDPLRIALSHVANSFVKGGLGIRGIFTMSSFYRLRTAEAIGRMQSAWGPDVIERAGFECMVEELLKMMHLGLSIAEVPMVLDTSRRVGSSKMKLVRTARGYLTVYRLKRKWLSVATGRP